MVKVGLGHTLLYLTMLQFFLYFGNVYADQPEKNEIRLRGAAEERYEDNITFSKINKKAGFSTVLALGLNADYKDQRNDLKVEGNVYHQIYDSYKKYNNTSEDFSLDYLGELSKHDRLSIKNNYLHAYEPRSFEQEVGRVEGRYGYNQNKFNLVYTKDMNKRLLANIKYLNDVDVFNTSILSNSFLNSVGVGFEYMLNSLSQLLSSYSYSHRNFNPGDSISTNTVSFGLRRELNKRTYIELQTGVDFIDSLGGSDYAKPRYSVTFSNELENNLRFNIVFLKEYTTNAYEQDIFDFSQIAVNFVKQLSKKLSCSLTMLYAKGKYLSSQIKDNFIGSRLGLDYELKRGVRIYLTYDYSRADSNISDREYLRNASKLGITMEF